MIANEAAEIMVNREIDILIAKLMGWRWLNGTSIPYSTFMSPEDQAKSGGQVVEEPTDSAGIGLDNVPRYSTDIGAAFEVEAEIEQRGLWKAYTIALVRQVRGAVTDQQMIRWLLIRAAPFDRCRAALVAVKGEGDGK